MARRKNYFSFLDFNFVDGATDLFNNTIRKSFEFDAYTDDIFEARVLTTPTPIVNDPASFGGSFKDGKFTNRKFSFRVRILGPQSPHRFLEDPCSLSDVKDLDYTFSLIQSHTQVFLYDEGTATKPKIGDVVKIKLAKSGHSFDTRRAKQYMGLVNDAPESSPTSPATIAECKNLSDLFQDFDFTSLGSPSVSAEAAEALVDSFLANSLPQINRQIGTAFPIARFTSGVRTTADGRKMIYREAKSRGIATTISSPEEAVTAAAEIDRLIPLLRNTGFIVAKPEESDHNPARMGGKVAVDIQSSAHSEPTYEMLADIVQDYFDKTDTTSFGYELHSIVEEPYNGKSMCPFQKVPSIDYTKPENPKNPKKCGVVHINLKPVEGITTTTPSVTPPADPGGGPPGSPTPTP